LVRNFAEAWFVTNPFRRFLVVAGFALGLQVYWFLTLAKSSDFPTGEVQYAVMPALAHPYTQAWQAPYGIVWYGIQYGLIWLVYPILSLFHHSLLCPNNCIAVVQYINGTRVNVPFEAGPNQWVMSLSWMIGLAIVNVPFFWILRKSNLLLPYFMSSLWLWATTPVNLSILWLIILGFYGWTMIANSLIAKLPVGAPLAVWQFALHSASSIGHWFPYGMLGFWLVLITLYRLDKWRHSGNSLWFPWLSLCARVIRDYE